jgi:hypothetical protein
MRRFRRRAIAALGLAVLAAAPLTSARALIDPPDYQATEKDFSLERFSAASVNITNNFLPIAPGSTFTLTGTANRGGGGNAHQVIFTVTEVTKMVNGVRTVVLWDRDIQEGVLVEEELAFWAQDDSGNVWLMGEYPEEHEGKKVAAPSTWLAGNQGSAPGILMRANPKLNTTSYKQGEAPSVEFLDVAKVFAADQHTCVPVGCFDGVLVVDEFDPNQQPQDGHQFKYHAPGVGIVQVTARGGDEQETLVATEHRTLTADELAAANARALELDTNAYTLAPAVFTGSAPAEVCPLPITVTPPDPTTPPLFPSRTCPPVPTPPAEAPPATGTPSGPDTPPAPVTPPVLETPPATEPPVAPAA